MPSTLTITCGELDFMLFIGYKIRQSASWTGFSTVHMSVLRQIANRPPNRLHIFQFNAIWHAKTRK